MLHTYKNTSLWILVILSNPLKHYIHLPILVSLQNLLQNTRYGHGH